MTLIYREKLKKRQSVLAGQLLKLTRRKEKTSERGTESRDESTYCFPANPWVRGMYMQSEMHEEDVFVPVNKGRDRQLENRPGG
jgi:hypothetical protein